MSRARSRPRWPRPAPRRTSFIPPKPAMATWALVTRVRRAARRCSNSGETRELSDLITFCGSAICDPADRHRQPQRSPRCCAGPTSRSKCCHKAREACPILSGPDNVDHAHARAKDDALAVRADGAPRLHAGPISQTSSRRNARRTSLSAYATSCMAAKEMPIAAGRGRGIRPKFWRSCRISASAVWELSIQKGISPAYSRMATCPGAWTAIHARPSRAASRCSMTSGHRRSSRRCNWLRRRIAIMNDKAHHGTVCRRSKRLTSEEAYRHSAHARLPACGAAVTASQGNHPPHGIAEPLPAP